MSSVVPCSTQPQISQCFCTVTSNRDLTVKLYNVRMSTLPNRTILCNTCLTRNASEAWGTVTSVAVDTVNTLSTVLARTAFACVFCVKVKRNYKTSQRSEWTQCPRLETVSDIIARLRFFDQSHFGAFRMETHSNPTTIKKFLVLSPIDDVTPHPVRQCHASVGHQTPPKSVSKLPIYWLLTIFRFVCDLRWKYKRIIIIL